MPTIVPVVDPLPAAPNRGMSSTEYPIIADAWAAKIGPWTVQLNQLTTWQGQQVDAIISYRNAASSSATAAAESATLAGQKVDLAADQVALAVTAKNAAAASAASAQASAAAAGSAAGLPALVGNSGKALVVKLDETGVEYKALGQAIGDVLETTRTPDATYLLPDTVYSRAAYPDLFAVVGTQGQNNDGASWSTINTNVSGVSTENSRAVVGKDNVVILISGAGTAGRSTDGGQTWAVIATANSPSSINATCIDTDGNGVWIAGGNSTSVCRSTDNGVTWSLVPTGIGSGLLITGIATDKLGNWLLLTNSANSGSKSINNGLAWTYITSLNDGALPGGCIYLECDGINWLAGLIGGNIPWVSHSFASRFYRAMVPGADGNISKVNMAIPGVMGFSQETLGTFLSFDGGVTWKVFQYIYASGITMTSGGTILISASAANFEPILWRSTDGGESFTRLALASAQNLTRVFSKGCDSNGGVLGVNNSNLSQIVRSTRLFNYDVATQFKTPSFKTKKGYKAYIKGKLQ